MSIVLFFLLGTHLGMPSGFYFLLFIYAIFKIFIYIMKLLSND